MWHDPVIYLICAILGIQNYNAFYNLQYTVWGLTFSFYRFKINYLDCKEK